MERVDDLRGQVEALRDRLSRLRHASLRINESLDYDTVLQGVLDSARSLTGARYGVITLLEGSGRLRDSLSSGLTVEEAQLLWDMPDGMRLFEYLGSIPEPLRIRDLVGHMGSLGLPRLPPPVGNDPDFSLLGAPVFHQGTRVGGIYVGRKEGGRGFTSEDEETLVLFASQAAMVIANARAFRDEQRARADLETLINTSPVGVVVLDGRSGGVVSINRETRRIVDRLRDPGQSPEQLLEVMTIRRGDGREVSFDELPLAQTLSGGETVRAEEIVMQVPDGRRVTVLVNATPIRSGDGGVESFVVTLQDMTDVEELERLRAGFLAMVSHELRMPLMSIKGSVTTMLGASLDPAETVQFYRIIDAQTDRMRELISDLLDLARVETGTLSVSPKPEVLVTIVEEAKNTFLSGGDGDNLRIDLAPGLPMVMADRRRIVQVLSNLLGNAARFSDESSVIRITAVRDGLHVAVSVSDRGKGVTPELLPHLFGKLPDWRTDNHENLLRGPGMGLAICKGIVEAHGGRIWAESDGPGTGTRFTFTIPIAEQVTTGTPADPSHSSTSRSQDDQPILVVDDDPQALRYVRNVLTKEGYKPIVTGDPTKAQHLVETNHPQLVLLDLMLPGTDGIALMKDILKTTDMPIIFLSVYGQEDIIAKAFDMGAVDYIVKPFSPTELAARIRAALRKEATHEPAKPYNVGDLTIDYTRRRVTLAGRPVQLTAIEYRLLAELSQNAGHVITYEQLLKRVWGQQKNRDLRPMRTVISSLRRKLGDNATNPTHIHTEHRTGYRMTPNQ